MWRHCVTHFEWDLNRFIYWSWLPTIIAIWQNLIVFVNCCCYLCCCCCCCCNDNIKSDVKNGLSKVIEKNWIFQRKQQKMRFSSHFWRREREKKLKYKFFPSNFFLPSLRNRFCVEKKVKMTNMKLASETQCTVVVAGDSRVGKTSLIQRFVNKTFQQVRQTNKIGTFSLM